MENQQQIDQEEFTQTQTQIQQDLVIQTNNFEFILNQENKQIFTYKINIQPQLNEEALQNTKLLDNLYKCIKNNQEFSENYCNSIFQDLVIYTPKEIEVEKYFSNEELKFQFEDTQYKIEFEQSEDVTLSDLGFVVQRIYRKLMKNLGLTQVGYSNFSEPKTQTQLINDNFYLQKNYDTRFISDYGKYCLQIQQSNKILGQDNYLKTINECQDLQSLKGEKIISEHSGKQFIVDKICQNMNVFNVFEYNNEIISYYEYFESRYNYQIQDFNQPLIKTQSMIGDKPIYLVPEVCYSAKSDNQIKYKDLIEKYEIISKLKPSLEKRMESLQEFVKNINQNPKNQILFYEWEISLSPNPVQCIPYTVDLGSYRYLSSFEQQHKFTQETKNEFFQLGLQKKILTQKIVILQHPESAEQHEEFIQTILKRKHFLLSNENVIVGNVENPNVIDSWIVRINAQMFDNNQQYIEQQNSVLFVILLGNNFNKFKVQLQNIIEYKLKQKSFFIPQSAFDKPDQPNQDCIQLLNQMHRQRTLMDYVIDDMPNRFLSYGNLIFSYQIQKITQQQDQEQQSRKCIIAVTASKFNNQGIYEIYYNQSAVILVEEIPNILPKIIDQAIQEYQKDHQIKKTCNYCNKKFQKVKDALKNVQKTINMKQQKCISCDINIKGQCYQCNCQQTQKNICLVCYNQNQIESLIIYRKNNIFQKDLNENKDDLEFEPIVDILKPLQIQNVVFINVVDKPQLKLFQINQNNDAYVQPQKGILLSQDFTNDLSSFILVSHTLYNNNNNCKQLNPIEYDIQDSIEVSEKVIQNPQFIDDLIVLTYRLTHMYLKKQCSHKVPAGVIMCQKLIDYSENKLKKDQNYTGTTDLQNIDPLFFVTIDN